MLAIFLRHRMWNWSNFLMCRRYRVHSSQPYERVVRTTALYTYHFRRNDDAMIAPQALTKSAKCNICFFKPGVNVIINGGGRWQHTAQVAEFVDHLELNITRLYSWGCVFVTDGRLQQYLSFLKTRRLENLCSNGVSTRYLACRQLFDCFLYLICGWRVVQMRGWCPLRNFIQYSVIEIRFQV